MFCYGIELVRKKPPIFGAEQFADCRWLTEQLPQPAIFFAEAVALNRDARKFLGKTLEPLHQPPL